MVKRSIFSKSQIYNKRKDDTIFKKEIKGDTVKFSEDEKFVRKKIKNRNLKVLKLLDFIQDTHSNFLFNKDLDTINGDIFSHIQIIKKVEENNENKNKYTPELIGKILALHDLFITDLGARNIIDGKIIDSSGLKWDYLGYDFLFRYCNLEFKKIKEINYNDFKTSFLNSGFEFFENNENGTIKQNEKNFEQIFNAFRNNNDLKKIKENYKKTVYKVFNVEKTEENLRRLAILIENQKNNQGLIREIIDEDDEFKNFLEKQKKKNICFFLKYINNEKQYFHTFTNGFPIPFTIHNNYEIKCEDVNEDLISIYFNNKEKCKFQNEVENIIKQKINDFDEESILKILRNLKIVHVKKKDNSYTEYNEYFPLRDFLEYIKCNYSKYNEIDKSEIDKIINKKIHERINKIKEAKNYIEKVDDLEIRKKLGEKYNGKKDKKEIIEELFQLTINNYHKSSNIEQLKYEEKKIIKDLKNCDNIGICIKNLFNNLGFQSILNMSLSTNIGIVYELFENLFEVSKEEIKKQLKEEKTLLFDIYKCKLFMITDENFKKKLFNSMFLLLIDVITESKSNFICKETLNFLIEKNEFDENKSKNYLHKLFEIMEERIKNNPKENINLIVKFFEGNLKLNYNNLYEKSKFTKELFSIIRNFKNNTIYENIFDSIDFTNISNRDKEYDVFFYEFFEIVKEKIKNNPDKNINLINKLFCYNNNVTNLNIKKTIINDILSIIENSKNKEKFIDIFKSYIVSNRLLKDRVFKLFKPIIEKKIKYSSCEDSIKCFNDIFDLQFQLISDLHKVNIFEYGRKILKKYLLLPNKSNINTQTIDTFLTNITIVITSLKDPLFKQNNKNYKDYSTNDLDISLKNTIKQIINMKKDDPNFYLDSKKMIEVADLLQFLDEENDKKELLELSEKILDYFNNNPNIDLSTVNLPIFLNNDDFINSKNFTEEDRKKVNKIKEKVKNKQIFILNNEKQSLKQIINNINPNSSENLEFDLAKSSTLIPSILKFEFVFDSIFNPLIINNSNKEHLCNLGKNLIKELVDNNLSLLASHICKSMEINNLISNNNKDEISKLKIQIIKKLLNIEEANQFRNFPKAISRIPIDDCNQNIYNNNDPSLQNILSSFNDLIYDTLNDDLFIEELKKDKSLYNNLYNLIKNSLKYYEFYNNKIVKINQRNIRPKEESAKNGLNPSNQITGGFANFYTLINNKSFKEIINNNLDKKEFYNLGKDSIQIFNDLYKFIVDNNPFKDLIMDKKEQKEFYKKSFDLIKTMNDFYKFTTKMKKYFEDQFNLKEEKYKVYNIGNNMLNNIIINNVFDLDYKFNSYREFLLSDIVKERLKNDKEEIKRLFDLGLNLLGTDIYVDKYFYQFCECSEYFYDLIKENKELMKIDKEKEEKIYNEEGKRILFKLAINGKIDTDVYKKYINKNLEQSLTEEGKKIVDEYTKNKEKQIEDGIKDCELKLNEETGMYTINNKSNKNNKYFKLDEGNTDFAIISMVENLDIQKLTDNNKFVSASIIINDRSIKEGKDKPLLPYPRLFGFVYKYPKKFNFYKRDGATEFETTAINEYTREDYAQSTKLLKNKNHQSVSQFLDNMENDNISSEKIIKDVNMIKRYIISGKKNEVLENWTELSIDNSDVRIIGYVMNLNENTFLYSSDKELSLQYTSLLNLIKNNKVSFNTKFLCCNEKYKENFIQPIDLLSGIYKFKDFLNNYKFKENFPNLQNKLEESIKLLEEKKLLKQSPKTNLKKEALPKINKNSKLILPKIDKNSKQIKNKKFSNLIVLQNKLEESIKLLEEKKLLKQSPKTNLKKEALPKINKNSKLILPKIDKNSKQIKNKKFSNLTAEKNKLRNKKQKKMHFMIS